MTSSNIQGVLFGGSQSRQVGGREFIIPTLLRSALATALHIPSFSLWNRAPVCPAHLLWPHYAATYTTLWWELLLWHWEKKFLLQFTTFIYAQTYTSKHTTWTFSSVHPHIHPHTLIHTHTLASHLLTFLFFAPELIAHARRVSI